MSPEKSVRPPVAFVVRIWFEPSAGGRLERRGYVEHVATGRRRYFGASEELLEFLAAVSADTWGMGDM